MDALRPYSLAVAALFFAACCCADPGFGTPEGEIAAHVAVERIGVPFRSSPSEPIQGRVVYVKTHKTASTTLQGVLLRYAATHGRRVYIEPGVRAHIIDVNPNKLSGAHGRSGEYDMVVQHHHGDGFWNGDYGRLKAFYNQAAPGAAFVSVLRNPVTRYASWFSYYRKAEHPHMTLEQFARQGNAQNGLVHEFGLRTLPQVEAFIRDELPSYVMCLLERFDESLVVLRHTLNWDLADMAYYKAFSSHAGSGPPLKRWDGRVVPPTPKVDGSVRGRIEELTRLDRLLYDAANIQLDQQLAKLTNEKGVNVESEVRALKRMVKVVSARCPLDPGVFEGRHCRRAWGKGEKYSWCEMYTLPDLCLEWAVDEQGHIPLSTLRHMRPNHAKGSSG